MTILSYKPLVDDLTSGVATFVYPPGSFTGNESGQSNRHPIRVFQFNSSTQACPKNMYLIMASMQLDCDVAQDQGIAPFYSFIENCFTGLKRDQICTNVAKEIYPEKAQDSTADESAEVKPSMKTEAELAEAAKSDTREVDPTPDVLMAVVYMQDSLQASRSGGLCTLFSNVHGLADADFDMDIDTNFHESESLFFNKLGYIKRDEDQEDSDDGSKQKEEKKEGTEAKEEMEDVNNRIPGCDTKKPVTFLERPAEVLNAFKEYNHYSDDEEDEDKLLDTLLEETKEPEKQSAQPEAPKQEEPAAGDGTVAESSNKVDDKSGTEVAEKEADLDDLLDDLL